MTPSPSLAARAKRASGVDLALMCLAALDAADPYRAPPLATRALQAALGLDKDTAALCVATLTEQGLLDRDGRPTAQSRAWALSRLSDFAPASWLTARAQTPAMADRRRGAPVPGASSQTGPALASAASGLFSEEAA